MTKMNQMTIRHSVSVLCILVFAAIAGAQTHDAQAYFSYVKNITEAADNKARGEAILAELRKLKIRVSTEGFSDKNRRGERIEGLNIIAEVINPDAKKMVMIGAHLDRVGVGTGAIDNASGSAAVISLLKAFRERPLKNIRLQGAFWDQEEQGLVGSRIYVQNRKEKGLPQIYINFDVFGAGDTLWLWSADENLEFVKNFKAEAARMKAAQFVSKDYPASDHRSFIVDGVQSYSFSLGPAGEAANIVKVLTGQEIKPENFPAVLRTIHTENDTIDAVDAKAVARALAVVEAAIRTLDK
ncbi:MAG: M28 family peptidase [Blastocatellia bacterium]|nr:M28 family peptidase [Blastocatellia bacterium]